MDQEQMIKKMCDQDLQMIALETKYVDLCAKYEDLRAKSVQKQEFEQNNANFHASLPQNSEFVKKIILDIGKSLDGLNRSESTYKQQIEALFERTFKCVDRLDSLSISSETSNQRHEENERRVYKLEQQQNEFRKIAIDYPAFQADIYLKIGELSFDLEKYFSRLKEAENKASILGSRLEMWDRESRIEIDSLKTDTKKIWQSIDAIAKSLDVRFSNVESLVDVRISNIPKVEIPPQIDVKAAVSQEFNILYSKLNDIKLDLENSALRFSNNDMQTKMFEKKIENLSLLLKKYEITK